MPPKRKTDLKKDKLVDAEDSSTDSSDCEHPDEMNQTEKSPNSSKDAPFYERKEINTKLTSMFGPKPSAEVHESSDNTTNQLPPFVFHAPDILADESEVPCHTSTCLDSDCKASYSGLCMTCNRSVDDPECDLYTVPLPEDMEIALRPYLSPRNLEQPLLGPTGNREQSLHGPYLSSRNREQLRHLPPRSSLLERIQSFVFTVGFFIFCIPIVYTIIVSFFVVLLSLFSYVISSVLNFDNF